MAEITAELVAVDGRLWAGDATLVSAQTTEGEIGVLPGHQPFLGQLVDNGTVTIKTVGGEVLVAAVQGGFLSVSTSKVTILADSAVWASDVDTAEAEAGLTSDDPAVVARSEGALRAQRRAKAGVS
ncbi:F0F1 ATP synthase subunit epsilon [Corynebacterium sp. TAE3-ERU12]|uniref:F0F1 ATP synthase subunit epsilon n=1 Tax=Corynebacterium sp. TAE3-ERU12 TaxID=2849491 RepID=UPI001C43A1F2|nr:F0F1 ATP synthase subunit epsilon [Corynebacterium sp. TAE3-ERU12]MBV7295113.1 F0F1 ATP synthase subunit epsilon [Corynebacterium sp. TAE3-ERU12]